MYSKTGNFYIISCFAAESRDLYETEHVDDRKPTS